RTPIFARLDGLRHSTEGDVPQLLWIAGPQRRNSGRTRETHVGIPYFACYGISVCSIPSNSAISSCHPAICHQRTMDPAVPAGRGISIRRNGGVTWDRAHGNAIAREIRNSDVCFPSSP